MLLFLFDVVFYVVGECCWVVCNVVVGCVDCVFVVGGDWLYWCFGFGCIDVVVVFVLLLVGECYFGVLVVVCGGDGC